MKKNPTRIRDWDSLHKEFSSEVWNERRGTRLSRLEDASNKFGRRDARAEHSNIQSRAATASRRSMADVRGMIGRPMGSCGASKRKESSTSSLFGDLMHAFESQLNTNHLRLVEQVRLLGIAVERRATCDTARISGNSHGSIQTRAEHLREIPGYLSGSSEQHHRQHVKPV